MKITNINFKNKKYEVYIDGEYNFSIFKKEIKHYNIKVEEGIDFEKIDKINSEVILPRGRNYVMHLLSKRDYTIFQIEQKLKSARYNEGIIDEIIQYFLNYGFLNDEKYIERYYEHKKKQLSYYVIKQKLYQKGIPMKLVDQVIDRQGEDEYQALKKEGEKKIRRLGGIESFDKNKFIQFMMGKGYKYGDIQTYLDEIDRMK